MYKRQVRDLAYNTKLKVTTAKYYIPSGRCIQALDYSHRNPDGSVGKVPDSLISEFKTQSGRKVYDGGGISPDIKITTEDYARLTQELVLQDLTFDFINSYALRHPNIAPKMCIRDRGFNFVYDFVPLCPRNHATSCALQDGRITSGY